MKRSVLTKILFDLLENLLAAELLGETGHSSDGLATISLCWMMISVNKKIARSMQLSDSTWGIGVLRRHG